MKNFWGRVSVSMIRKSYAKRIQAFVLVACMLSSILSTMIVLTPISSAAEVEYNFAKALQLSLYFYDANKCGEGITGGCLEWRGDCHVEDNAIPLIPKNEESFGTNLSKAFIDANKKYLDPDGDGTVDLSGGMHDAGDHVKFGLPGTYAGSTVGWGFYEFREAYEKTGQDEHAKEILRWFNDFFLKCSFFDENGEIIAFCYQVGEGNIDHNFWNPPELQDSKVLKLFARPAYFATPETPASDMCAGAAASLAINYLNFKDEDPEYAKESLDTAIALYEFAKKYRGLGYDGGFYTSSYDYDELSWAAVWLNIITGDMQYIDDIISVDEDGYYTGYMQRIIKDTGNTWQNIWVHCWDTIWGGVFAKLAPITDTDRDWYIFRWNLEYWSGIPHENTGDTTFLSQSPAGFSVVNPYGSTRYNTAAQLCALVYRKETGRTDFADWSKNQMEYIMGNNPMERSYIVGYSENCAKHPHHRAAHGSKTLSMLDPPEHRHTLWGALVGGPDLEDYHKDETTDYVYNEVAIDYNAAFVGACAGLWYYYGEDLGHKAIEGEFPPKEPPVDEFYLEAKVEQENKERTQVTMKIYNFSCHPPRFEDGMMTRYFFNINELLNAGQTIDDVRLEVYYDENKAGYDGEVAPSGPVKYDDNGIYYVEFDWSGRIIYGTRELQFALIVGQDSNYNSNWDHTNDFSRDGLTGEYALTEKIPLYLDGVKVFGNEPPKGNSTAEPSNDPNVTPSPTPLSTPSLQVMYQCGEPDTASDIRASIRIKNTGRTAVDLSDVKVRYWYTKEGAASQTFSCDYAHMDAEKVTGKFVDVGEPAEDADNYLEIGFADNAGSLGPGADTGVIQFRIVNGSFGSYDLSNDYSYDAKAKDFVLNSKLTAYVKSELAYGVPPIKEPIIDIVYGDLNDDGVVNSTDYSILKRYILGTIENVPKIQNGDLNGDGSINSTDYGLLKRYILGLIPTIPIIQ